MLDAIAEGRLTLSSADLLRPHLDESNVDEVIALASGMSKSEVLHLIAKLAPKPDVADSIQLVAPQAELAVTMPTGRIATVATGSAALPSTPVSAQLVPLSEDRYQVTFTASSMLRAKLERGRALSRHRNLNGDLASVVERALDLLIEDLEKTMLGKTKRPRKSKGSADPGHVTRETRREVIERDAEQCTFVSVEGERCTARELLELDHQHPRALGGAGDTANVRILCRAHNQRAAEQAFGREHMEAKRHPRHPQKRGRTTTTAEPITSAPAPVSAPTASDEGEHAPATTKHDDETAIASNLSSRREPALESAPVVTNATPSRPADPRPPREIVRSALVGMGFRDKDAERAIQAVAPSEWSTPLETILRDAILRLT